MKFTQWVVEWCIAGDVWWAVIVSRKKYQAKPLMADTKKEAERLKSRSRNYFTTKGVKYRVRKVAFGEIAQ